MVTFFLTDRQLCRANARHDVGNETRNGKRHAGSSRRDDKEYKCTTKQERQIARGAKRNNGRSKNS